MTTRPVPMSGEVLAHLLNAHKCDADVHTLTCPCRNCRAYVCEECGEVLFAASREATWCRHAAALWEAYR